MAGAIIVVSFDNTNTAAVADLCLNVNSTGAYHIKRNNSGTIGSLDGAGYIKASTSYMFYFDGTYWVMSYDTNTNTLGYTIRTNGLQLPVKTAMYRYRICFTSADGEYFVPANSSTSTSATASKTVTTEKIDPFGRICYYNTTTAVAANSYPTASYLIQQYNGVTLGYSFNRTGAALTLTNHKPVYIKCAPQTDGSAIIDADNPFVQALPSTADGKLYIFLGIATAATTIEMVLEHPVYEYKGGHIREYTPTSEVSINRKTTTGTNIADITIDGVTTELYAPTGGGGGGVTDVEVDGTSVVTGGVAEIDLTGKSDVGHTHTKSAITDFPTTVSSFTNDAGYITGYTETDPTVPSWAKEANKPSYSASEISGLVDFFYPIGSYYETSDTSFDPNLSWGGTWVLEAEGLVHIGAGNNYTVGANVMGYVFSTAGGNGTYGAVSTWTDTKSTGGGKAHNNMQPYIVVNRWHRTA